MYRMVAETVEDRFGRFDMWYIVEERKHWWNRWRTNGICFSAEAALKTIELLKAQEQFEAQRKR